MSDIEPLQVGQNQIGPTGIHFRPYDKKTKKPRKDFRIVVVQPDSKCAVCGGPAQWFELMCKSCFDKDLEFRGIQEAKGEK